MSYINWQLPLTIATGNKIANETVFAIWRKKQQTVTTENRVEWLSSPPPRKAPLRLVPSYLQLCHKPRYLGVSKNPPDDHPPSLNHHLYPLRMLTSPTN